MNMIKFGILTVSDSCFQNANLDKSGPKLVLLVKTHFTNVFVDYVDIVPDEENVIKAKLIEWSDDKKCDVILTTGGTGFATRDVTPEATKAVINKEALGISNGMLNKSLTITPFAMISRAVSGIRNKTLIINFPGSVKAIDETFKLVSDIIPHAVSVIHDDINYVKDTHLKLQGNNIATIPSKVILGTVASRERTSKYAMIEVTDAIEIIKSVCVQDSNTEEKHINNALGFVLAEDIRSIDPLPPFPASIKDGYAVKAADGIGKRLVCDVIAAGDNPKEKELKAGQCVRISTGAAVPPGADAVVQVEDTELLLASTDQSKEIEIEIKVAPKFGQDIRSTGSDIEAHSIVLRKGSVLNAAEIGVLAAVGKISAKVFKRLSVGIISTGNEVQDSIAETLQPGCIRDSNKITLMHLLAQYGYASDDCGIARDEPTLVKHTLERAFANHDMIITTGGVSMGEFDILKRVLLEDFGAIIHFGRVNMKPGKPTTFATCVYHGNIKIVFGLPGNPVSATVTCLLFVIPALRHCENRTDIMFPKVLVEAAFFPIADPFRPDYQRVKLSYSESSIVATTTGNQISSKLNSFVDADGLMLVPAQPPVAKFDALPFSVVSDPVTSNSTMNIAISAPTSIISPPSSIASTSNSSWPDNTKLSSFGHNSKCNTKARPIISPGLFSPLSLNNVAPVTKYDSDKSSLNLHNTSTNPLLQNLHSSSTTQIGEAQPFKFGAKAKYMCYILKKF